MSKLWTTILGFISPKLSVVTDIPLFKWYRNVLWAIDFLINALTFGDPRETVSSVLGKMQREGTCLFCQVFCRILSVLFMEKEHCKNSIQERVGRGTENDASPIPGLRREWSNAFVVLLIVMAIYKDVIWELVGKIT